MESTDSVPLPVLDGTNYRQWKLRMSCILEAKGLEDVVYKNAAAIVAPADTEDKTFKQKMSTAKMILVCSVDSKHTSLIESCRSARDIWQRLETEYSFREPVSLDMLLIEYYTYKKDPAKSISEYISDRELC